MANTWNQALTTWGQNTWGKQADVTLTLTGQSSTATVGSLTELVEVKPGWGTLNWGENGWGSVEEGIENLDIIWIKYCNPSNTLSFLKNIQEINTIKFIHNIFNKFTILLVVVFFCLTYL